MQCKHVILYCPIILHILQLHGIVLFIHFIECRNVIMSYPITLHKCSHVICFIKPNYWMQPRDRVSSNHIAQCHHVTMLRITQSHYTMQSCDMFYPITILNASMWQGLVQSHFTMQSCDNVLPNHHTQMQSCDSFIDSLHWMQPMSFSGKIQSIFLLTEYNIYFHYWILI